MNNYVKKIIYLITSIFFVSSIIFNYIANDVQLKLKNYLIIVLSLIFFSFLIKILSSIKMKTNKTNISSKKIFIVSFISILFTSLIFLITYYPGVSVNDTIYTIHSPVNYSYQYPLFSSLIYSSIYKLYYFLFKSVNFAYFCLSFTQIIVIDLLITNLICWFNKKFNCKLINILLIVYFSCLPIIINYNCVIIRDSLFSALMLCLIPLIYELIESNGKLLNDPSFITRISLLMGIISLVRNNGIYIFLFLILMILLKYKKYWKQILCMSIIFLLISNSTLFLPSKFQKKVLFQEKMAVPLEQIAYLIKYKQSDFTSDELKYLDKVFNIDYVIDNFDIYTVDAMKWSNEFNNMYLESTKSEFMKIWYNHLLKNFGDYVECYLRYTNNLWCIKSFEIYHGRFLDIHVLDGNYVISEFADLKNVQIMPNIVQKPLTRYFSIMTIYFNNGALFWILIFLALWCIKVENKMLILLVPYFGIWITLMIACPIPYATRYMCSVMYALPFLISIIVLNNSKNCE